MYLEFKSLCQTGHVSNETHPTSQYLEMSSVLYESKDESCPPSPRQASSVPSQRLGSTLRQGGTSNRHPKGM